MAQIWLSYDELGETLGCTPPQARQAAIQNGWARMKSRSGVSHVRLPAEMTERYLLCQLLRLKNEGAARSSAPAAFSAHSGRLAAA